jgi:hypothetical protein
MAPQLLPQHLARKINLFSHDDLREVHAHGFVCRVTGELLARLVK